MLSNLEIDRSCSVNYRAGYSAGRVQLTTDDHNGCLPSVEKAFGGDIDYAMLVKQYGEGSSPLNRNAARSSPCISRTATSSALIKTRAPTGDGSGYERSRTVLGRNRSPRAEAERQAEWPIKATSVRNSELRHRCQFHYLACHYCMGVVSNRCKKCITFLGSSLVLIF